LPVAVRSTWTALHSVVVRPRSSLVRARRTLPGAHLKEGMMLRFAVAIVLAVIIPFTVLAAPGAAAPIDCALEKKGVSADSLHPFADTEKYIQFLEQPDRASWQKPD
jgi:hypothetical protein